MFALIAAVLFALAVIFDLAATSFDRVTSGTLVAAGLFCLALHLAGYATGWRPGWRTHRRRRRTVR